MAGSILLPYDCFSEPTGPDAVTRLLHKMLPLTWQKYMRDRVMTGLFDGGAVVLGILFAISRPATLPRFLSLGRRSTRLWYGPKSHQTVELHRCGNISAPLAVFVHGGAWCSGAPWMYRLVAESLMRCGMDVALVGYGVYSGEPDVGVLDHQVDDLRAAVGYLVSSSSPVRPGTPLILVGHSSGAHICAMLLLREVRRPRSPLLHSTPTTSQVIGFVALAGVFDIAEHFWFEARRGVHEVSGMKAACGPTQRFFNRNSPTVLVDLLSTEEALRFPPTLVMAGTQDETVPWTNSVRFANVLHGRGIPCTTVWLENTDHFGPVERLMFGSKTRPEIELRRFKEILMPRSRL